MALMRPFQCVRLKSIKSAVFDVNGSTFSVSIKESKQSLKFYIDNERSIEHGVNGLLGFTMAESYTVRITVLPLFKYIAYYIF